MSKNKKRNEGEVIPLIWDFMFTSIFNKEENIVITENFIACYFCIPIEEVKGKVKILSRNLKRENKYTANKQVDMVLELGKKKINIEVSTQLSQGIIDRNVVFASNIHSTSYRKGDKNYRNITDTIQINLVYDRNHIVGERFKEEYYLRNELGKELTKKIRIDYVNIAKVEEACYTEEEELKKLCRAMIASKRNELEKWIGEMKMEEEAKEKLIEEVEGYSRDEEVYALYSDYTREELERNTILEDRLEEAETVGMERGLQQGMQQGIQQGIRQGSKERTIEIVRNMLNEKIDIPTIIKLTGLSKKEIEELK